MKARTILVTTAVAVIIALGGALTYARTMSPQLELGVGYAARVACGCRYEGNRALGSCYKDFEPGMAPIRLSDDPATRTVTASVPLIASRSARYDPILGCQPDRFDGQPLAIRR
jgi:hypothetical protein